MDTDAKIAAQYDPAANAPLPFKGRRPPGATRYPKAQLVRMDSTMFAALEQAANDHGCSREECVRSFIAMGLGDLFQLPRDYHRPPGRSRRRRPTAAANAQGGPS